MYSRFLQNSLLLETNKLKNEDLSQAATRLALKAVEASP